MPLPNVSVPKYPITVPSSKKKTVFRPFLMKEQKILFMALESKDQMQMLNAMCDIVENCIEGIDDAKTLPLFDLEYLFLKIRSKSVGEVVEARTKCPQCSKTNEISINLETVEIDFPKDHSNKVMLSDKMGVILKYPTIKDSMKEIDSLDASGMVKYISDSIEMVFDGDMTYSRKDFTTEEIANFVDTLNAQQFEKMAKFYTNLPQLHKETENKCLYCGHEYKISFRGLQDFFI